MFRIASWSTPARRFISESVSCSRNAVRKNGTATARQHDPLNILFCGADDFSITSLKALNELHLQQPQKIATIDVVCRHDKRVGRGLKQIREVPIKGAAKTLGLPLHQIDTFTGWSPPSPFNLIVAVSFGLLVPPRILNAAKYGGLNVHPSLLPDLRGPAPIVHTLLKERTHTGVTLQTMHPTRFDHGEILAQTPAPGIRVPQDATPVELLDILGTLGAETLSRGIEKSLFVSPIEDLSSTVSPAALDYAPKITPEDRHIDWKTWNANTIIRNDRILGRLWDLKTHSYCSQDQRQQSQKRTTFHGPWRVAGQSELEGTDAERTPGHVVLVGSESGEQKLGIVTADSEVVIPTSATIEGEQKDRGIERLVKSLRTSMNAGH